MIPDLRPRLLVLASTYPRWVGDYEPGFVHELSKRLTEEFDVTVLCPHAPGALSREHMEGVQVVRYRYAPQSLETLVNDGGIVGNIRKSPWKLLLLPGFFMAQLWVAWRMSRAKPFSAIHAHWLIPQGLIAGILKTVTGTPFMVTSHGTDLYGLQGKPFRFLKKWVARHAGMITVVSSAMRSYMRATGLTDEEIHVQPMGVDMLTRFTPDDSIQRSARDILFVGRLVETKGLQHLLYALPRVLERIPDARLIIAGFGPGFSEAEEIVKRFSLQPHVQFLGAVPQTSLPKLYRSAALFVAPFVRTDSGQEEGLGLVQIEAIACGCPVLVGNTAAAVDVLGDANMDVTVDSRDHNLLAERIIAALLDPVRARKRAQRLRLSVGTKLDWQAVAGRYADLLNRLKENKE